MKVVEQVPLVEHPSELAVGHGSVWVSDSKGDTVTRVRAQSLKVRDPIAGGRPAHRSGDRRRLRVDRQRRRLHREQGGPAGRSGGGAADPVGRDPVDLAVAKGAVWTANSDDSTVTRIRP